MYLNPRRNTLCALFSLVAAAGAFLALAGCGQKNTPEAIKQGVVRDVPGTFKKDSTDVRVDAVSFRGKEAGATVTFTRKGGSDAQMHYLMELRSDKQWHIKSPSPAIGALTASVGKPSVENPTPVPLSWSGGELRVKSAPFYVESFVFDPKQNRADVPSGTQFDIAGGYPVPIRILSMGFGFQGGTITPVYQNVALTLDAVPREERVLDFGVIQVSPGIKYHVHLIAGDETSLFVDAAHTVYPGPSRDVRPGGPFATLRVKADKTTGPVPNVRVLVKERTGVTFTATTDVSGEAVLPIWELNDRFCTLSLSGFDSIPLPLPVVAAGEGLVEYAVGLRAK
jgi:hypothetical protein